MHTHQRPRVVKTPLVRGGERRAVEFEDGCSIQFDAPQRTEWNGGWLCTFRSPGFGPAEIDAARRLAWPERR